MKFIIKQFSPRPVYLPFRSKYSQHSVQKKPSVYVPPSKWDTKFRTRTAQLSAPRFLTKLCIHFFICATVLKSFVGSINICRFWLLTAYYLSDQINDNNMNADWIQLAQECPMAGSCEQGNEPAGSINGGEFIDYNEWLLGSQDGFCSM
jgi:hypothetical protein